MHVSWLLFMIPKILSLDLLLFTTSIRPEAEFHTVMQWQTIQNHVELFGKCKKMQKKLKKVEFGYFIGTILALLQLKENGSYRCLHWDTSISP